MAKSKYTEDFPKLVEMYMREGMIEADAAKKLGISVQTFEDYKKRYPEFMEALKKGKAPVDFEVENALLKRALGYEYIERKEVYVEDAGVGEVDGGASRTTKEVTETIKAVAPDVTAAIFWLKNRKPKRWRDIKAVEMTGKDGTPLHPEGQPTTQNNTTIIAGADAMEVYAKMIKGE